MREKYSELEVANKYKDWNAENIYERGKKLLDFMSDMWNLGMSDDDKKALLHLYFLDKNEETSSEK